MAAPTPLINKIAPPKLRRVINRRRLFAALDKSSQFSAIWLAGPAGSGKTSLVASYLADQKIPSVWYHIDARDGDLATFFYYLGQAVKPLLSAGSPSPPLLTPEYALGIETFVIRYFENLCQRMNTPVWIVLDNFQEVPVDSQLLPILIRAIDQLTADVTLTIISRNDPPEEMARLRANRMMMSIGGRDLNFTLEECKELGLLLDVELAEEEMAQLHMRTGGWVAGLILWFLRSGGDPHDCPLPLDDVPAAIFDYFANEVLEKSNSQTRQFLLKTALMPYMTADTAGRLTKMEAADILIQLNRRNYFLEKRRSEETTYQYHPLFRDFLIGQGLRTFRPEVMKQLQIRAADILADAGLAEEAVDLYGQAECFAPLIQMILTQAPLLTAQGRTRNLAAWIDLLPTEQFDLNPWLLFWRGLCKAYTQPHEGQKLCIKAFEQFVQVDDIMGQVFSWSLLIETFLMLRSTFQTLDRWILEGRRLEERLPPEMDPEIAGRFAIGMVMALTLRTPGDPDVGQWQDRCENLIPQCYGSEILGTLGTYLCLSYGMLGQINQARALVKQLQPLFDRSDVSPFMRLSLATAFCIYFSLSGNWSQSRRSSDEALAMAQETGIHIYDFVILAYAAYHGLLTGNLAEARPFLERLEGMLLPHAIWDTGQYHYMAAVAACQESDWAQAKYHIDMGHKLAVASGVPFTIALAAILRAQLFIQQKDLAKADIEIDAVAALNIPHTSGMLHFLENLARADCALVQNNATDLRVHLNAAFGIARSSGLPMPTGYIRPRLAVLCAEALQAGIHGDLVIQLISRLQLPPPAGCSDSQWPWPIKIFTLGRLDLICAAGSAADSAKLPKKQLELLQLLTIRNERGITREAAADALWPDTEGDRAIQNINTTLHRLRRLLGQDQAVRLKNGRLGLNPSCCWIDAWHFESLLKEGQTARDPASKTTLLSQAVSIYSGHFHDTNWGHAQIIGYAQRLRTLWIDAVVALSRLLSKAGRSGEAEKILQNALTIDIEAEPIYRSLMAALRTQGRFSEAVLIFNRCRNVLTKLGREPARDTLDLYHDLQSIRPKSARNKK